MTDPVFTSIDPLGRRLMLDDAGTVQPQMVVQIISAAGASIHTALPAGDVAVLHAALGRWIEALR